MAYTLLFGKTLEREGGFDYGGLPWYDSPTAQPCRAVALRQPHFVYVLLMGFAPLGLCSVFVFCLAGVALHFTPAGKWQEPSLRDLGLGTEEPQRGERVLGRRWSIAEPLPTKRKTKQ